MAENSATDNPQTVESATADVQPPPPQPQAHRSFRESCWSTPGRKVLTIIVGILLLIGATYTGYNVYENHFAGAKAGTLAGKEEIALPLGLGRIVTFPTLGNPPTDVNDKVVWMPAGDEHNYVYVYKNSFQEDNFTENAQKTLQDAGVKNVDKDTTGDWRYVYGRDDTGVRFRAITGPVHADGHLGNKSEIEKYLGLVHISRLPSTVDTTASADGTGSGSSGSRSSGSASWNPSGWSGSK